MSKISYKQFHAQRNILPDKGLSQSMNVFGKWERLKPFASTCIYVSSWNEVSILKLLTKPFKKSTYNSYLVFRQERMPHSCALHVFISIKHTPNRSTSSLKKMRKEFRGLPQTKITSYTLEFTLSEKKLLSMNAINTNDFLDSL